jgi:hypothetical protein
VDSKKPNSFDALKGVIPVTNEINVTDRRKADADLVRAALEGNEDALMLTEPRSIPSACV